MARITREIGIDAGHRVPNHHSKCSNLHGHRYTIQAMVEGEPGAAGSTEGMAGDMDFGFLKEEMMAMIDAHCDHALILWRNDPLLELIWPDGIRVRAHGPRMTAAFGKVYVMSTVPTAENLAAHWFGLLAPRIVERSAGRARLVQLRVYETPNCWADAYE